MTARAREVYVATASQTDFNIPFSYRDEDDVVVKVNGVTKTQGATSDYIFFSSSVIRLNEGASVGDIVVVRRRTSQSTKLVDFTQPGAITEEDLDLANLQAFYMGQEALDTEENNITLSDTDNIYSANDKRIRDVGAPSEDTDAARLQDVQDAQIAAGNVPTPGNPGENGFVLMAQDGSYDWVRLFAVSVKTFGAVGDGVTDDTDAFEDAIATANGGFVYVPDGDYLVNDLNVTAYDVKLTGTGRIITNTGHYAIKFDPAWGSAVTIGSSTTTTINSKTVTRLNCTVTGLAVGDVIKVVSEDFYTFSSNKMWNGELAVIVKVNASSVDLDRVLYNTYTTNAVFRKLPTNKFQIEGLHFLANGTVSDTGITTRYPAITVVAAINPIIKDVVIESSWERGIQLQNAFQGQVSVTGVALRDLPTYNGFGYLVDVTRACDGCRVSVLSRWARHAVTTGYLHIASATVGSNYKDMGGPVNTLFHDSVAVGAFGGAMFDTHEGARFTTFFNCKATHPTPDTDSAPGGKGFQLRGHCDTLIGCEVESADAGVTIDAGVFSAMSGTGEVNTTSIKNMVVRKQSSVAAAIVINSAGSAWDSNHQTVIDGLDIQGCASSGVNMKANVTYCHVRNMRISGGSNSCKAILLTDNTNVIHVDGLFVNAGTSQSYDPVFTFTSGGTAYINNVVVQRTGTVCSGLMKSNAGTTVVYLGQWFCNDATFGLTHPTAGTFTINKYARNQLNGTQRWGLGLANGSDATNDIDCAVGAARDSTDRMDLRIEATHTKQIDVSFAEYSAIGTPSGGRDSSDNLTGAKWFRVYVIGGPNKNTQLFFSTSASPTLPSGFLWYRRLRYIYWDGSAIRLFLNVADRMLYKVAVQDGNLTDPGTSANTITSSAAPPDAKCYADVAVIARDATPAAETYILMTPSNATDTAPSISVASGYLPAAGAGVPTATNWRQDILLNSSGAFRIRFSASTADHTVYFHFHGFRDPDDRSD